MPLIEKKTRPNFNHGSLDNMKEGKITQIVHDFARS